MTLLRFLSRPGPSMPRLSMALAGAAILGLVAMGVSLLLWAQGCEPRRNALCAVLNALSTLCSAYHAWRWWPRHLAPCPQSPDNRRLWGHMPCDCADTGGGARA